MRMLTQVSVLVVIAAIACTQIFLLFKYFMVRKTLLKMQETSSGDHSRFKNGIKNHVKKFNKNRM
jgi:hypothetical protein